MKTPSIGGRGQMRKRRAGALRALESLQRLSNAAGRDRMPISEINRIVKSVRRSANPTRLH